MRLTIHRGLRRQTRELRVTLQGRELPDYAQIRVLRRCDSPLLVALARESETRSGRVTLCYDLSDRKSLRRCLKSGARRKVDLRVMLCDLVDALEWCARSIKGTCVVLFDPQYVYVGDGGHLSFVLLPLKGCVEQSEQSPFALLGALADVRHDRRRSPNEREMAKRLSEFVGGEGRAFSLNRLRAFVRMECSAMGGADKGPVQQQPRTNEVAGRGSRQRFVLRDWQTGRTHRLEGSRTYELGRGQACDIRLEDCPKVSRRHVAIRCLPEGLMIEDLGSTNGTYVAGRRIVSHQKIGVAYGQMFVLSNREFSVGRGES